MQKLQRCAIVAISFLLSVGFSLGQSNSATVNVPGTANPYLAGWPAGTRTAGGDTAPAQSPPQVTGIIITPGIPVRFFATGRVTVQPADPSIAPNGNASTIVSHPPGAENGISNIFAPQGAVIGVFLSDQLPLFTPAPGPLDFSTPASRTFAGFSPALQQLFFIGDGSTGGTVHRVIPPPGATRLFIAVMDQSAWADNTGSFTVVVETGAPAGGVTCNLLVRNSALAFHRSEHHVLGLSPDHNIYVNVVADGSPASGVDVTLTANRNVFPVASNAPATVSAVLAHADVTGRAVFTINPPSPQGAERTDLTASGTIGGRPFACQGSVVTGLGFGAESAATSLTSMTVNAASASPFGKRLPEILAIASKEPGLLARAQSKLKEHGTAIGRMLAGDTAELTASAAADLNSLFDNFYKQASPELRGTIDLLRSRMRILPAAAAPQGRALRALRNAPVIFEPDAAGGFAARGPSYALRLSSAEAVLSTNSGRAAVRFAGARGDAVATPLDPLPGTSHYLIGRDPSKWQRNVAHYAGVKYAGVYPGIDAIFHSAAEPGLEFDFVVEPGADPAAIRLAFPESQRVEIDAAGDAILHGAGTAFRLRRPVLYQGAGSARHTIAGKFTALAKNELGFDAGEYDRTQPLVIDPVFSFAGYFGGARDESGLAMAVDGQGNLYVAGTTGSTDTLTGTRLGPAGAPGTQYAFVIKFDSKGANVLYSTYIGGTGSSGALGIAVDASGAVYLTGSTTAANFPLSIPFQKTAGSGSAIAPTDAFVLKLNPGGSSLAYSSYLGGSGTDVGRGIAVDASGSAYVAGFTSSPDFPRAGAFQNTFHGGKRLGSDAFLSKVDPTGAKLTYSLLLGGADDDLASAVAVDAAGNAFVTGVTYSLDFPTRVALINTNRGGADAFVTAVNPAGTAFLYSTYLGGTSDDFGLAIAIDKSSSAYVTGMTGSVDFPIVSAAQPKFASLDGLGMDAFVTKLTLNDGALAYSTFLGGAGIDMGVAIAVASDGSAVIGGETSSADFPLASPVQNSPAGMSDGFLAALSPSGQAITFSTFVGGSANDAVGAVAVDSTGNIYAVGSSASSDFPATYGVYQADNQGRSDVIVMKVAPGAPAAGIVSVSAASLQQGPAAPESIVSGFGQGFAAGLVTAQTLPLGTTLGDISVHVKDRAGTDRLAPLYAVSPGQINYLIPTGSATGLAQVTVNGSNGSLIATGSIRIDTVAPALFAANANGQGVAAAIVTVVGAGGSATSQLVFQCGNVALTCVPVPFRVDSPGGAFLSLYGTGIKGRSSLGAVTATAGGVSVPVSYAGPQSESPGLDQVNIGPLPASLAGKGIVDVVVTVDGRIANTVTVRIL